jgi:hypothetical protein
MSFSTGDIVAVATLVLAIVGGLSVYLNGLRSGSGKVSTSEAGQLWQQTQGIIDNLQEELTREQARTAKAEEQRDKLLDLQKDETRPLIEAISASQKNVLDLLTRLTERIERRENLP